MLPSVLKYIEVKHQLPDRLLFSLACLIRFYKGDWQNEIIPVNDTPDILNFFNTVWKTKSLEDVARETLANTSFWGQDLNQIKGLTDRVTKHLTSLEKQGVAQLLAEI